MKTGTTGLQRIINAAGYSYNGLKSAWQNEAAFRQEAILCLVLIPLAFWIGEGAVQISLLIMTCLIVLITELLNSSIEAVVDRIGDEYHQLAGRAKDLGSAAVFVSLTMMALVWIAIVYENYL